MATCADCKFWAAPPAMDADKEAIALRHGQNRDGGCHWLPRVERTGAAHWCGQHKTAAKPAAEAAP